MSYSRLEIEKFSENSRFLTFFPNFRGFKINYLGLYSAYFSFFLSLYPVHLRIHKYSFQIIRKKQVIRPEKCFFFQIENKIKWELYQNSFWVYVIWLVFPVVFENISCPTLDFIPMSNLTSWRWTQTQNRKFLQIFHKIHKIFMLLKLEVEIVWAWNFQD